MAAAPPAEKGSLRSRASKTKKKSKKGHAKSKLSLALKDSQLRHEPHMDEVYPNLWLGSADAALDDELKLLNSLKITHVVSIGCYQDWWQFRKVPKHLLVPLEDTPFVFITDFFESVFAFIDEALSEEKGVLVHCERGKSRSGACIVAYLMKKLKKGYPETLNLVLKSRKRVMPNIGFQIQLRAFAKHKWNVAARYSDETDIDKELAGALRNLSAQVLKLQSDIRGAETIFVTISKEDTSISKARRKKHGGLRGISDEASAMSSSSDESGSPTKKKKKKDNWIRTVEIGLNESDIGAFRKEWVLLVFLCHQFQQYKIAVHRDIVNILYILAEMYFSDLLVTFAEVFHPRFPELIMDYSDPSLAIAAAKEAYSKVDASFDLIDAGDSPSPPAPS